MLKYVITGTGRCGTGYMSRLMSKYVCTCGHEKIFTPTVTSSNLKDRLAGNYQADSSWLAIPHLDHPLLVDVTLIHLTRHPVAVIASFLSRGFFPAVRRLTNETCTSNAGFAVYAAKYLPKLKTLSDLDAGIYWYIEWNKRILAHKQKRYWRVQLEHLPFALFDHFKLKTAPAAVDLKPVNGGKHTIRLTAATLRKSTLYSELQAASAALGYAV